MKTTIEVAGHELTVEYDFKITAHGCPESGPSYYSGGEPAEPAEFEIEVIDIRFPKQASDVELFMPEWLNQIINTHLSERDDINDIIQQAAYDNPEDDYK